MADDVRDVLLNLARVGLNEPVWINRVVPTTVCEVTGGQLFLSSTRVREACRTLASQGLIDSDELSAWTAAVWITEKGMKRAASYDKKES